MNMKEFLEVCEKFFNEINPNIYDDDEEDVEKENEEKDNEISSYNLCHLMRDTLLLINPRMKSN
jgi:hypothetical protein